VWRPRHGVRCATALRGSPRATGRGRLAFPARAGLPPETVPTDRASTGGWSVHGCDMPFLTNAQHTTATAAPRIAVFGEWDTGNLGDRAILEGVTDFFQRMGWCVDAYALGSLTPVRGDRQAFGRAADVAEGSSTTPPRSPPERIRRARAQSRRTGASLLLKQWLRPARQYWRIRQLLPQIGRAQAVLVGGGALLSDEHLHFPQSLAVVGWAASKLRLPVFCLGCSAEGAWSPRGERILAQFIRSCRVIATRDAATARRVAAIRGQPVAIFGDFALSRAASPKPDLPRSRAPRLAVNVMQVPRRWQATQPFYEDVLVHTMDTWRHRHGSVRDGDICVFTTGAPEDIGPASRVLARLSLPQGCLYVPSALPGLRSLLQAHTTVVASRLHAAILSIAAGIPVVGLAVGPKIPEFFQTLGLQRYSIPIQEGQAGRRMLDLIDGADLRRQPMLLHTAEIDASRAAIRSLLRHMEAGDAERQASHESVSVPQAFSRSRSEIDGGH
jgi:polysaccharide pyruvyl transferase WcaK-like protein